jgi:cytochrome P450
METIFAYPPVPQTGQRALMARFSRGEEHSRRRGYAVEALSRINVEEAQAMAAQRARTAARGTVNAAELARQVIVEVLEKLLGLPDPPDTDPEVAANRAGLVLQARDATAGLVANALLHNTSLEETLREHPPVVNTRRIVAGEEVVVDLRSRPFGGPPRPCPGQELALALAGAILDVLRSGALEPFDGTYEDWPNLRIPATLKVSFAALT